MICKAPRKKICVVEYLIMTLEMYNTIYEYMMITDAQSYLLLKLAIATEI